MLVNNLRVKNIGWWSSRDVRRSADGGRLRRQSFGIRARGCGIVGINRVVEASVSRRGGRIRGYCESDIVSHRDVGEPVDSRKQCRLYDRASECWLRCA